jgi:hypothetical protein
MQIPLAIYRDIDVLSHHGQWDAVKLRHDPHLRRRRRACSALNVARIRTTQTTHGARVTVTGRLTASDMARLEHACADALVSRPPRLQIDVSRVTQTDRTAAAILQHLAHRGVMIIGSIGSLL